MGMKWRLVKVYDKKSVDTDLTHEEVLEVVHHLSPSLQQKLSYVTEQVTRSQQEEQELVAWQQAHREEEELAQLSEVTRRAMSMSDCCIVKENLIPVPSDHPGVSVVRCRICGRRHFGLTLDPGVIGTKGVSIG